MITPGETGTGRWLFTRWGNLAVIMSQVQLPVGGSGAWVATVHDDRGLARYVAMRDGNGNAHTAPWPIRVVAMSQPHPFTQLWAQLVTDRTELELFR